MPDHNETKNNFAYAFVELLQNKPVDKITITELCKYANYSRETFYYHFEDKYDLMSWIHYAQVSWHIKKYYGTEDFYNTISRIEKGIKELNTFYISGFSDYRFEGLENNMIDHSTAIFTEMVKVALEEEELADEVKFLIQFNAAGSVYMVKYWIMNGKHMSHREFARLLVDSMSPTLSEIFKNYRR